jgi:hypothetical protein
MSVVHTPQECVEPPKQEVPKQEPTPKPERVQSIRKVPTTLLTAIRFYSSTRDLKKLE